MRPRLLTSLVLAGAAAFAAASCSIAIDPDVGSGLGAPCDSDEECQASSCIDGLCAVACGADTGCPGGTTCASGSCQLPLGVVFLYPYDVDQDETSRSFDQSRDALEAELGYVRTEGAVVGPLASEAVTRAELVDAGQQVIVSTSAQHAQAFEEFAADNPELTVVALGGRASGPNYVPFDVRTYQAYYLAGLAAGEYSSTRYVGMIASVVTPKIVAAVNAFALGAQAARPEPITVYLRWLGEPHDTQPKVNGETRERRYTDDLIGRGADVIAHTLDNSIPLYTVADRIAQGSTLYGIGANVPEACSALPAGRCLGTTWFNWAPLLAGVLEGAHRFELDPRPIYAGIEVSNADSPIGFTVGEGLQGGTSLAAELDAARALLASEEGVGSIFDGPIRSTGQCEAETGQPMCVAEGERLSDEGLRTMCWLVEGIVDETGAVAMVPNEGDCE